MTRVADPPVACNSESATVCSIEAVALCGGS